MKDEIPVAGCGYRDETERVNDFDTSGFGI
jgi:hypothetical protein